jgi:hypothetical protein
MRADLASSRLWRLVLLGMAWALAVPAQIITNHDALPQPDLPKPQKLALFTEPVFGSTMVRITDARLDNQPGAFPQYAKRQAWNADESLMLLTCDDGSFSLYDGTTYRRVKSMAPVGGEDVFWHPTRKEIVLYNPGNEMRQYNVLTDDDALVVSMPEFYFAHTRGEGNLSRDGRYYACYGCDYDEATGELLPRAFVVVDLDAKTEISRFTLTNSLDDFDWISISPLGNYVVVDYATLVTGRFNGIEVYDRQFKFLWQKPLGSGHSDLTVDGNGDECLVIGVYDDVDNESQVWKYRLRDGKATLLLGGMNWSFYNHISCRNTLDREWCWISAYDGEGRLTDDSASWLPFEDEVFAVKLDGSLEVRRVAHHRSRRFSPSTPDGDNSVYWAEPHATASPSGTRILFGSNWREHINESTGIDAYVVDLRRSPAPRIDLRRSGLWLELSWPVSATNYVPEWKTTLSTAEAWHPWTGLIEPDVTSFTTRITPTNQTFFLRLQRF